MNLKKLTFTEKARISRYWVLALLAALLVYYTASHIANGKDVFFRIVVSLFPLLIFLPGILARKYRSASLLCFVLLLYFMLGVESLFIPGNALAESIAMTIIVLLFNVCMFYSRWQQRADVFESKGPAKSGDSHPSEV